MRISMEFIETKVDGRDVHVCNISRTLEDDGIINNTHHVFVDKVPSTEEFALIALADELGFEPSSVLALDCLDL